MQQGMQQGLVHGVRGILAEQFSARFGELPPPVRTRLEAADLATLHDWGRRLLSATRIEDLFGAI
jgi:hypothetical protein